jgi:predicted acyltransferase
VTGQYAQGYNLANHLDFQFLPGKKWETFADPEGLLSTLPAIASCLLGVFAGLLLRGPQWDDGQKVKWLLAGGAGAVVLGLLWSVQFPIVKKIWTSSFVLVAGGCSAILLGVFYQVVDVWKKQSWCQPFVWMGMNSITVYLASNFIGGFRKLGGRLAGGDVRIFLDQHVAKGLGDLVIALTGLALAFCFVRFLHRRKIFLRL